MSTTMATAERLDTAARQLYDAECALHAAHQAHDDAWVSAASERLHAAVESYLAARRHSVRAS